MSAIKDFFRAQGKALGDHPAFHGSSPISIIDPNNARTATTLSQREAKRHLEAYGGSESMDWVTSCVNLIMETASSASYRVTQDGQPRLLKVDLSNPSVPVIDPILGLLLEQPNPHMTYADLLELSIIDYLLVGNAYWYKYRSTTDGRALALYRLSPAYVKVKAGPYGPIGYEYCPIKGRDPLVIPPEEIVHFRRPNPHSAYYGLGLIQQAGRAADAELAITDTVASYYENGAHPSLIVQSDKRVPRDVIKKLRLALRGRNAGSSKAGELMVLEAGLKATTVSTDAASAAFEPLTRLSRDRIFAWFRCSPKLLGIMDEAGGADKITDAQRIFDNKMMRPLLDRFQTKISMEVTRPWGYEFEIPYEYQMPMEDRWRLISTIGAIPGITVDELRTLAQLPKHPDKSIGELTLNMPGENAGTGQPGQTPTSNGFPDRGLAGEPGRPPNPSNTKVFPSGGGPLPAGAAARRPSGKALTIEEVLGRLDEIEGKANTRVIHSTLDEERPTDLLADRRDPDLDPIIAEITGDLSDAAHDLERALLDHLEGKALGTGTRRRIERSRAWTTFTQGISRALDRGIRRALSTAAIHHASVGLRPDEELDYDALAGSILHRAGGVRAISANLRKAITSKLSGLTEPADVEQVIRGEISQWQTSQAETVAMTEAVHGYNEATLSVAEMTGHTHVSVSDGTDHDEPCVEADGQVWTIEHARSNRLEHPRCRRAFVPVPLVAT